MLRDLSVKNEGWVPTPLTEAELAGDEGGLPEAIRIRGFRLDKKAAHVIKVAQGERYASYDDTPVKRRSSPVLVVDMCTLYRVWYGYVGPSEGEALKLSSWQVPSTHARHLST